MKKKIFFSLTTVIMVSFASCMSGDEIDMINSDLPNEIAAAELGKVELVDGVLKFRDAEALSEAIEDSEIVNAAITKTKSSGFISLGSKYAELEESYELILVNEDTESGESTIDDCIENRVRSRILVDLLNEDGVMMVGDLAIKVIGDYGYTTHFKNLKTLLKIKKTEDVKLLQNVSVDRIIEPLVSDDTSVLTKGSTGGAYTRSALFTTTSRYRREHVEFVASLIRLSYTNPDTGVTIDGGAYAEFLMEGRAQTGTKAWPLSYIIWGASFGDEMVWGEVRVNSGSWWYNQPPAGQQLYPQGTNYLPILTRKTVNERYCYYRHGLGLSAGVNNLKADVTFKFLKHSLQPTTNYTSEFRNSYTSVY